MNAAVKKTARIVLRATAYLLFAFAALEFGIGVYMTWSDPAPSVFTLVPDIISGRFVQSVFNWLAIVGPIILGTACLRGAATLEMRAA